MAYDYHVYRRRILPSQLDRARKRYYALMREVERYGMFELLGSEDQRMQEKERIPVLDIPFVLQKTAEIFGTTEKDIRGDSRFYEHSHPRMILYYTLRDRGLTFGQIGRHLGRDPTTVRYGCNRAEKIISDCPKMRIGYRRLKEIVQ